MAETTLIGTAEVAAGAGHDSNIFLALRLDPTTGTAPIQGWFGRTAPSLAVALAGAGWRSELSYDLDFRRSDAAGSLFLQQASWSLSAPVWGAWQPRVAASLVRFSAPSHPEEDFWSTGCEAGLRVDLSSSWRLLGTYRLERRVNESSGRWLHQAEARTVWKPSPLVATGLGLNALRLSPDSSSSPAALNLVRLGPDATLVWGSLIGRVGGWAGVLDDAGAAMRDWQVGAAASLQVRLFPNLDATVWADWSRSVAGAADGRYFRRVVLFGLVGHVAAKHVFRASDPPDSLAPLVVGRRVRFRFPASGQKAVRVWGAWNGWRSPSALVASPAGPWEIWLNLPAGSHRYRFWVDGQVVEPPQAPRYAEDDFGGRDGVVDVISEGSQP